MTTPTAAYNAPTSSVKVSDFRTQVGEPSYLDITVLSGPSFGPVGAAFDGWCLDTRVALDSPANYVVSAYSTYESSTLSSAMPTLGNPGGFISNLDSINWLMGYYNTTTAQTYTYGDVQAAIWTMMGQDWHLGQDAALGAVNQTRITTLVNLALAHDGYVPDAGEPIGIVLDPVNASGVHAQPIIIETQAAKLGDHVWADTNANGLQDGGEVGIAGAAIQLVRDLNSDGIISANEVLASAVTDANGDYAFKGLTPGLKYQVQFGLPAGYTTASPRQADGNAASGVNSDGSISDVVVLKAGENNTTIDSGFYKTASLGDRVWTDSNANGLQDSGEAGVAGVTVNLCDANGVVVATKATDGSGNYLFSGLKPGSYSVQFVAPANTQFTSKDANANASDALDSDADKVTGKTGIYTLASGDQNLTVDAGIVPAAKAHLGDFVFEDKNANGLQDAGEPGIAGVTVNLCDAAGNVIGTTTTGTNGSYGFDVAPGTYGIKVTAPAGYFSTIKDANGNASDTSDSDIDATGKSGLVTLSSGQTNNSIDAGLYRKASLGDFLWVDGNGNGLQDPGETPGGGVTVSLLNSAGTVVATQLTHTTAGTYLFTDLTPGAYAVQFALPGGYTMTTKDVGGNASDATDSDADPTTNKTGLVTLSSGEVNRTVDAGVYLKAHLGDFVFEDKNANGLQDAGEPGIAGVTVNLCDAAGNVIGTTTTGTNGSYGFDVAPGTYGIKVTAPAGYFSTIKDANGNASDTTDSDIDATGKSGLVTLSSGQTNNSIDAGLYRKASLGDFLWVDGNGNGRQDPGETPGGGVTVSLLNSAGTVVATQLTHATAGTYLFSDLTPGAYAVQFALPGGYTMTTKDVGGNANDATDSDADPITNKTGLVTLSSGEVNRTVDAGVYLKAHLGDFVFDDKNGNGLQDTGEPGIAGVTVNLIDAAGLTPIAATTTTGANGSYGFDVAPGTYAVQVVAPAGYTATTKDANANGSDAVDSDIDAAGKSGWTTLSSGQTNNTIDAGFVRSASIGDRVWLDANANGLQDSGEVGVANATVNLLNSAGTVVATQTTNASGSYLFDKLVPGTYSVQFVAPVGFKLSTQDAAYNFLDSTDSDANATTGKTGSYTLAPGASNLTVDAGLVALPKAHLGDFVFEDKNANGLQDTGEPGIAGVTVNLIDAAGLTPIAASTTTDANGKYSFDVLPGTYAVKVVAPTGYGITTKDANANGSDAIDSDVDATGQTPWTTLVANQTDNTLDAGLYRKASLGDKVWMDANGNGLQDTGEPGLANVSVNLLDSAGNVLATKTTDANGNYLFDQLATGAYSVKFNAPAGYVISPKDANANASDTVDSDADSATGKTGSYTLASGVQNLTVDAGMRQVAHLGDFVFIDGNGNGLQDAGEPGLAGVTVNLIDASGVTPIAATTTTDANGKYGFDVSPGTYAVQVVAPAGYGITTKDANGNASDAIDSDIDATGRTPWTTIAAGQVNNTLDAGLLAKTSIGDRVWLDANANGLQDTGEVGLANVSVNLLDAAGNVVATKTTDANGNYLFGDIKAGTYSVKFNAPAGYYLSAKDANANASDSLDSDADATTGKTGTYTLAAGQQNLTVDAGMYQKAHLGDFVWLDSIVYMGDGLQGKGEPDYLIPGATVNLLGATGTTVLATTTTDATSHYGFDVLPGTYRIQVLTGAGATLQNVGTNDAIDSDVNFYGLSDAVTLKSGEVNLTVDAGFQVFFTSPLVLDLDGSGRIETTRLADSTGAFDLLGTGRAIQSGWVTGGDGFLAVDNNGNGRVDNVSELFGGNRMGEGFAKLAGFDSNGDGLVDMHDAKFGQLMIWRDANGNHQTDAGEMVTLAQAGVASLVVDHTNTLSVDAQGNGLGETSSATLASGASVTMTDVYFKVSTEDAKAAGVQLPTVADVLGDDRALDAVLGQGVAAPVHLQPTDVPLDGLGEATELIRRITAVTHDHVPFAVA